MLLNFYSVVKKKDSKHPFSGFFPLTGEQTKFCKHPFSSRTHGNSTEQIFQFKRGTLITKVPFKCFGPTISNYYTPLFY